jgi:signal transduction histidine kinase/CheY-like chemotaxis protein
VGAFMDITSAKSAEIALIESERRERLRAQELAAVLEAVPAAIIIADSRDCQSVYGSRQAYALLRLQPGQNLSKSAPDGPSNFRVVDQAGREIPPEELPLQKAAATGVPQRDVRLQLEFEDGTRRHLFGNTAPLLDEEGTPRGAVQALVDITELVETEQQLRIEVRRKDEFLATLAHELRNPMAPIRYATAMLKESSSHKQLQLAREVIARQSGHMARLLDDLLDVARITRGIIELHRDQVDVCDVLREAINLASPALSELRHQLVVTLPPETLTVNGDSTRLLQVFENLLDNAGKYTPSGGRIEVQLAQVGDEAVLQVRDSGVGLTTDMIPCVFDLFTRLHTGQDGPSRSGLGIGLTLSKRLVELHGGSIKVASEGLRRGATFTVRLPLSVEGQGADRHPQENAIPLFSTKPPVLVVDDNADAADSLAELLRSEGFPVTVAYDGLNALGLFDQIAPGIVLIDMGLPDISGQDVSRQMRERPCGRKALIIAITGWGQEEDFLRSRIAGVDEHIVKPVDPNQLFLTLRRYLAQANAAALTG